MNIKDIKNLHKIDSFNGNFALIYTDDDKIGLVNRQGEIVLEPEKYSFGTEVINGIFAFDDYNTNSYLTYDANTQTRLSEKHVFHHGTNINTYEENGLIGVCNEKYETLIAPKYEILLKWQDRLLGKKNGKWGIIDLKGSIIVPFIYEDCIVTAENMIEYNHRAVAQNGEYFWIDINGLRISKHTYKYLQPRNSKGYAIMKQDGKIGIIDAEENILCLTDFSEIEDGKTSYSHFYWCTPEHISFYQNGLFGIMDIHGKVLQDPQYSYVNFQPNDYLISCMNAQGKAGIITPEGRIIIPFEYDWILRRRKLGLVKVRKNNKYGVMDEQGNLLIPIEYDLLNLYGDKGLEEMAVKKNGKCFFINNKQERVKIF